jgi:hypothetical protein
MAVLEVEVGELEGGEAAVLLEGEEQALVELGREAVAVVLPVERRHPRVVVLYLHINQKSLNIFGIKFTVIKYFYLICYISIYLILKKKKERKRGRGEYAGEDVEEAVEGETGDFMFVVAVHEGEHGRHLVQQKGRWRLGAVGRYLQAAPLRAEGERGHTGRRGGLAVVIGEGRRRLATALARGPLAGAAHLLLLTLLSLLLHLSIFASLSILPHLLSFLCPLPNRSFLFFDNYK